MRTICVGLAILVAWAAASAGALQEDGGAWDPAPVLAEIAELLDRAIYFTTAAIHSQEVQYRLLHAQAVLNLLEGPASPDYDPENSVTVREESGIRPLLWSLVEGRRVAATAGGLPSAGGFHSEVYAWGQVETCVRLAYVSAVEVRRKARSVVGAEDDLRTVYALLVAARGGSGDPFLIGGIQTLLEFYPPAELWVRPGESIQAVIDRVSAGATIHLEPGVYREAIVIDKDLTLIGEPVEGRDRPMAGIAPAPWDAAILIEGDGVDVELRNLFVAEGRTGIVASGHCTVRLWGVWIGQVDSAIVAVDGATVYCTACEFGECEMAIVLSAGGSAYVSDSIVRDCSSSGILILARGSLTMTDTTVSGCGGGGIYLQEDASLHLERCSIRGNEQFGVFAYTAECESLFAPDLTSRYGFTGTITGANNTIPGPDEQDGNGDGDVCPEAYRFLKESGPMTVPPGQTD